MPSPRVLHVNDAAFTTMNLLAEARRRGLPWQYLPIAGAEPSWHGAPGVLRRAIRGLRWEGTLARRALTADLLHVHVASVVRHTGWVPRPYVLHLHGTDIRTHQYLPQYATQIRRAVDRAAAVLYSTPDLAPHVAWRPDATLLPVPIHTSALPRWTPADRPTVVFASRWEEVKGLDVQVRVADLITQRRPEVRLVGVHWGSGADSARRQGVELVARRPHGEFLQLMASAHVVVGQPTGMLAASELEAVGIGVPVVAALRPDWYPPTGAPVPPLLGGLELGTTHSLPPQDPGHPDARALDRGEIDSLAHALTEQVLRALDDPRSTSERLDGPAWLAREHDVARAVDDLVQLYDALR